MTTTIPVARQDVYRFSDDLSEDGIPLGCQPLIQVKLIEKILF